MYLKFNGCSSILNPFFLEWFQIFFWKITHYNFPIFIFIDCKHYYKIVLSSITFHIVLTQYNSNIYLVVVMIFLSWHYCRRYFPLSNCSSAKYFTYLYTFNLSDSTLYQYFHFWQCSDKYSFIFLALCYFFKYEDVFLSLLE